MSDMSTFDWAFVFAGTNQSLNLSFGILYDRQMFQLAIDLQKAITRILDQRLKSKDAYVTNFQKETTERSRTEGKTKTNESRTLKIEF